jgi:mannose-1-phosphate guanylyltransferase
LTFGIRPTRPETGYGYLQVGSKKAESGNWQVHLLERFVEKPDADRASALIESGDHLWNSGMFAWRTQDLLAEVRRQLPELAASLDEIAPALDTEDEHAALEEVYPGLQKTSIDYGIMEGAETTWTIPVDFPWSDVGSWPALAEVLDTDVNGNVVKGNGLNLDGENNIVVSEGPSVTVVGASNLVVVATQDAVLVVPADQAQKVKDVVAELQRLGRDDLL